MEEVIIMEEITPLELLHTKTQTQVGIQNLRLLKTT
jgi:hypothetical protein